MRIIFMGTPRFAVPSLRALVESGQHEVVLAVTQPDRPKGRSGKPSPTEVKRCAEEYGIPVFQPEKIKVKEAVDRLRTEAPDIIVVAAFGQILSQEILDLPRYGCINVHGSLLPRYRGAAPVQWAVINGEKESGITIMQMDAGLDTGDILTQERIALDPGETAGSLYEKLSHRGGPLLLRTLEEIGAGTVTRTPQDNTQSCYAGMLRREMGELDWNRPAESLRALIQGLNPWPGAYTHRSGKLLKIWTAEVEEKDSAGLQPGTILYAAGDRLLVQTGNGVLALTQLQTEGKRRMTAREYIPGSRIRPGEMLGVRFDDGADAPSSNHDIAADTASR